MIIHFIQINPSLDFHLIIDIEFKVPMILDIRFLALILVEKHFNYLKTNEFAFRVIFDRNCLLKLLDYIKTNKLLHFNNELKLIESNDYFRIKINIQYLNQFV